MVYNIPEDCQIPHLGRFYTETFGNKFDGTFVEIGAYDGESMSNTCFLADMGWKGFYFEPVKDYYEKCKLRHKDNNVEVFNKAIGKGKETTFYVAESCTTSMPEVTMPCLSEEAKFDVTKWLTGEKFTIKTESLVPLVEKIQNYDLLVIDVEGMENEVINECGLDTFKPTMVIIELHKNSTTWTRAISPSYCDNYLKQHGYKELYSDKINSIYIL